MLCLDGVYVDDARSGARFRWVAAPTGAELTGLSHTMAHRVSRFLERQGLLVRDDETAYLSMHTDSDDPMASLIGHSVTYRIATGPRQGRKVLTLQTRHSDQNSATFPPLNAASRSSTNMIHLEVDLEFTEYGVYTSYTPALISLSAFSEQNTKRTLTIINFQTDALLIWILLQSVRAGI